MYISANTEHVVVPWRQDLAALIPHAKTLTHNGASFLVIPNGRDEAKLARNLGVQVPSPILTRYDWPGDKPPWAVQKTTAALLTESSRAFVLSTMGTGKSRSAIWALDYLRRFAGLRRALIAAPLSTLSPVWEAELFRLLPERRVVVLHGSRQQREAMLKQDADFYVINHHGLMVLLDQLVARGFDALVIDELAVFRNRSTELWKAANKIVGAPGLRFAWGMTGSPTPHAPTDAWAQIRLLQPAQVSRTMAQFKDQTMKQVSPFKWVPRPEANSLVLAAMQPSVRYVLDDVQELPPTTYLDKPVKLTGEAKAAYKMMVDKMRVLTSDGTSITAVNEGVLHIKLLQVALGYIYTDKGTVYRLEGSNRLEVLRELVDEADRKLIVYVPFVHALKGVAEALAKDGHAVATVHGATPRGARDRIFGSFQDKEHPRILVAHPRCMAHGLTLTAANVIAWYGPPDSLETYEQANARIVRPSQTSKTLIAHLGGTLVEKQTYVRLRTQARMQGLLLELFRNQEVEF